MIRTYPLEWPLGYPTTALPVRNNNFKTTFARSRDECIAEIKRLGGKDIIVSTDIPTKLNGMPYADAARRTMKSQGVAVYFNLNNESLVFCCDKWDRVEHNMCAIKLSIEAIRGLGRWGVSDMLKRVFTGFEALPQSTTGEWWQELGVGETASPEIVKAAYRAKMLEFHPDRGGDRDAYERVNAAWQKYSSLKK